MDDRKWSSKKILTYLLLSGMGFGLIVCLYGGFVYWQTQNIEDPKKCFKTKMFDVYLCPTSSSYVRYNNVPKHFFQALVLSEDAAFWSHNGFDWFEIKESFRRNILEWKYKRGGSTLTQQLAKNLYLKPDKSLSRKFKEFFIAKQIEEKLTKSQILEKYINVVEFGNNIFGLKQGANHYFGKHPSQLNLMESIYLVSLLPSPKRLGKSLNERKLSSDNIWRMDVILKRMFRTNKIDKPTFESVRNLIKSEAWPFYQFELQPIPPIYTEEIDQNIQDDSGQELPKEDLNSEKELREEILESQDQLPASTAESEVNDSTNTIETEQNNESSLETKGEDKKLIENDKTEPTNFEYPEKETREDELD